MSHATKGNDDSFWVFQSQRSVLRKRCWVSRSLTSSREVLGGLMGYLGLCKVQPGKPHNLHSLSQFSAMISVINTQILLSTFFVRHCARNFSNYIVTSNLQNIAYIDIYIYKIYSNTMYIYKWLIFTYEGIKWFSQGQITSKWGNNVRERQWWPTVSGGHLQTLSLYLQSLQSPGRDKNGYK